MIRIYGATLDALRDRTDELFCELPASISKPWQERHPNLREESARCASLAGVWLLWKGKPDAILAYNEDGKPFLQNFEGAVSITHTKTHVFCAISDDKGEIGLDAEDFGRINPDRFPALADRWFSESEQEALKRTPSEDAFLEIWTKKEALVKLTGEGMRALHRTNSQDESLGIRFACYRLENTIVSLAYPKGSFPPTQIIF